MSVEAVVIIGAGPAGLACAIQLERYGIQTRVFERAQPGGLLRNANRVENYPGFPGGIPGWELVQRMLEQAQLTGVTITLEEIVRVNYQDRMFQIESNAHQYQSRIVVIASGTRPRLFQEPAIPERLQSHFFYEVVPLLDAQQQRIVIIGAGDAAFDYAINLSRQNEVWVLNRGSQVSCLPLLWERAQANAAIHYYPNAVIINVLETPSGKVQLGCLVAGRRMDLTADHLVAAIGREADLGMMAPEMASQRTELEADGVLYFIGDVQRGFYRQTAIAAGDGLLAAMKIYQMIKETR